MESNLPPRLLPNLPGSHPGASLPWDAGGGSLSEATYIVSGFADADYYVSASAPAMWGTLRVVLRTHATRPVALQSGTYCSATDVGATSGWRLFDNVNGFGLWAYDATAGLVYATQFLPTAASLLYALHYTCAPGAGGALRAFTNGAENGAAATMTGGVVAPTGNLYIGRSIFATYPCSYGDVVSVFQSPTVMTPAQIADDAATITSRTSRLVFPTMPGEVERYVAKDLVATPAAWHDRDGDNLTLTTNGAPTVALLA